MMMDDFLVWFALLPGALRGACLGLDTEIVSCPCLFGVTQGVQSTTFGADLTAEAAVGKAE